LTYEGHHTSFVQRGLTIGFALFIVSEVFAFVSVFWAFFHSSLAPVIEIGSQWPPVGIEAVNAFELPLLNTILLLSSGATVTYSHHALIQGNRRASLIGLILTIILALAFTACQGIEYYNTSFSMSDSVYGTVFFASTGLHGLTLPAPVKNYIKKYLSIISRVNFKTILQFPQQVKELFFGKYFWVTKNISPKNFEFRVPWTQNSNRFFHGLGEFYWLPLFVRTFGPSKSGE